VTPLLFEPLEVAAKNFSFVVLGKKVDECMMFNWKAGDNKNYGEIETEIKVRVSCSSYRANRKFLILECFEIKKMAFLINRICSPWIWFADYDINIRLEAQRIYPNKLPYLHDVFGRLKEFGFNPKVKIECERREIINVLLWFSSVKI
jgi:hypothetical protein